MFSHTVYCSDVKLVISRGICDVFYILVSLFFFLIQVSKQVYVQPYPGAFSL